MHYQGYFEHDVMSEKLEKNLIKKIRVSSKSMGLGALSINGLHLHLGFFGFWKQKKIFFKCKDAVLSVVFTFSNF